MTDHITPDQARYIATALFRVTSLSEVSAAERAVLMRYIDQSSARIAELEAAVGELRTHIHDACTCDACMESER